MPRGPKPGTKQTKEHIAARFRNRNVYNRGKPAHNRYSTSEFKQLLLNKWQDIPYSMEKLVYITNSHKIILTCSIHGDFEKWPCDALAKSGCPKCSNSGLSSEEYIADLTCRFPEYDFTNAVYTGAKNDMEVSCREHGKFTTTRNKLVSMGVRCPECSKKHVLEKRIKSGRAKDPNTLTEYEKYRKEVWKETNINYKKHKEVLGERSRTKHLDHIYSIVHGFRDNISPKVLGNIVNLRIIDAKDNQTKNTDSHFTKEELLTLYEAILNENFVLPRT